MPKRSSQMPFSGRWTLGTGWASAEQQTWHMFLASKVDRQVAATARVARRTSSCNFGDVSQICGRRTSLKQAAIRCTRFYSCIRVITVLPVARLLAKAKFEFYSLFQAVGWFVSIRRSISLLIGFDFAASTQLVDIGDKSSFF